MADITMYVPAGTTVDVREGTPPTDQSALVAQLQARVTALEEALALYELKGNLVGAERVRSALGDLA